ncbi:hypothetical protein QOT17_019385 [Balamuthia mandrillaris]
MTAIKESERWAKMFTKKQTKETVAEYEERLRLEMVGEFQRRMKFAKAHYFEKKCDDHCPHLERIVDLDSMDRSTPFTALPPEILFHIATQVRKGKKLCLLLSSCKLLAAIGRHSTLLKRKKGCDCETKEADNSGEEKVCDRCKKEYCDDGNGDPVWIEKIQKVKEKIDSIVAKADGDAYLDKHQKSLAPVFEEDTHTKQKKQKKQKTAPDLSVAKVSTVEEVSKLQGKALEAQIILFNLLKTYKGDSTKEGQKKRLAEFVSNPSAFQHYVRPHKPRATPPRCSSSFSAVAAHSPSSAVREHKSCSSTKHFSVCAHPQHFYESHNFRFSALGLWDEPEQAPLTLSSGWVG